MDGRATVTIVPSRMIIKLAAHNSHSASWRRPSTGVLTVPIFGIDRSCSLTTGETVADHLLIDNLFQNELWLSRPPAGPAGPGARTRPVRPAARRPAG